MKTHTTIGYNICMRDEKLRPYSAGAIYHHEALNGLGYPKGLSGKDIPLVGQIIRVADEFDAITSKRQYKTHVGVCDTLNILIEETVPSKNISNDQISKLNKKALKFGKTNPKVVKALIKVIIDDTEFEIYNLDLYLDYLKDGINRLEQIHNYRIKMDSAKTEANRVYFANGMDFLFEPGETLENYEQILLEYKKAYDTKKQAMEKLKLELKAIKKLRV